jgi:hypothetical protein
MARSRRIALIAYAGLTSLFPGEFRRRHREEMQLDFEDEVHASATGVELALTVGRACWDLAISLAREWCASEALRLLIYANLAHAGIWLTAVAVSAWQWPRGPHLYPVVLTFGAWSVLGVALTVWRQRNTSNRGGCSVSVAELD